MSSIAQDAVKTLGSNVSHACDTVQRNSRDAAEGMLHQVRKYPVSALAIAALTGAVIGMLARGR